MIRCGWWNLKNFSDIKEEEIINWLINYASSTNLLFSNKTIITKLQCDYRLIKGKSLSIRRTTHFGQNLSQDKNEILKKFKSVIIQKRKELNTEEDENYCLINMDEAGVLLEMGYNTTMDFRRYNHIEIETNSKDKYRITVILSSAGDSIKLVPLIIVKSKPGKTVENNLRK